jgi:hypothetical protein
LLGKNASIVAGLPCVGLKNKTVPSAAAGVWSKVAPAVSVLRKLEKTQTDGSSLQGASAGSAASLPFLFGKIKTALSAATQDVVDVALYASLSNILGVSQSSGSTVLEKVRLLSHATIEGRGGTRSAEGLAGAEGSVGNESRRGMTVAVAPASCATRS